MRNIKLVVEYDGTAYCGWQTQKNGPTVQETLESAIGELTGEKTTVHGSGRTDSGVHAAGQTASFTTESNIPAENLADAVNTHLPEDISVLSAEDMHEDFHARYSAVSKLYRYTILNRQVRPALGRNRYWFCRSPLDVERMRKAAGAFVGRHDFSAFCAETPEDAVRTVMRLDVHRNGDVITVDVEANGFLYNMVRRIVGTLAEAGRGKLGPDEVRLLLEGDVTVKAGATAPPQGLCLIEVKYSM